MVEVQKGKRPTIAGKVQSRHGRKVHERVVLSLEEHPVPLVA
jgi:hypothetical protein